MKYMRKVPTLFVYIALLAANPLLDKAFASNAPPQPGETQWVPLHTSRWDPYADTVYNDGTSSYTEIVDDKDSFSGYMYYDRSYRGGWLYIRMALDSPDTASWQQGSNNIRNFGWMLFFDADGDLDMDWGVQVLGGNPEGVQVLYDVDGDNNLTNGTVTWSDVSGAAYTTSAVSCTVCVTTIPRSSTNGDSDVWMMWSAPLSAFQNAGALASIYETTPMRVAFGTGASAQSLGRDISGGGTPAGAFTASQIVTASMFASGGSSSPGGALYDDKDTSPTSIAGTWKQKNTITITGNGWPTNRDTLAMRLVYDSRDTTQYSYQADSVSFAKDSGTFSKINLWTTTVNDTPGVYGI